MKLSRLLNWPKAIEGVGIKVDFEKAFNKVNWPSLKNVMIRQRFSKK